MHAYRIEKKVICNLAIGDRRVYVADDRPFAAAACPVVRCDTERSPRARVDSHDGDTRQSSPKERRVPMSMSTLMSKSQVRSSPHR
jgi:hypothetical protein